jgi:hypothetical protein
LPIRRTQGGSAAARPCSSGCRWWARFLRAAVGVLEAVHVFGGVCAGVDDDDLFDHGCGHGTPANGQKEAIIGATDAGNEAHAAAELCDEMVCTEKSDGEQPFECRSYADENALNNKYTAQAWYGIVNMNTAAQYVIGGVSTT